MARLRLSDLVSKSRNDGPKNFFSIFFQDLKSSEISRENIKFTFSKKKGAVTGEKEDGAKLTFFN